MTKEEFVMGLEKIKIAELNEEQLKEVNALERKLGLTLIAYESRS